MLPYAVNFRMLWIGLEVRDYRNAFQGVRHHRRFAVDNLSSVPSNVRLHCRIHIIL